MKNSVSTTNSLYINVNGNVLHFNFDYHGFTRYALAWEETEKWLTVWEPVEKACDITFKGTQEEYQEWVQPLVDLYEAQLQSDDYFKQIKQEKLQELLSKANKFEDNKNNDMYFTSSLGFKCNGDRRTKDNLQDLITFFDLQAQEGKLPYRDYDNNVQQVTKENLQTLLVEHVANGNNLYTQKWAYEQQINNAKSIDDLKVININFEMTNYEKNM